MTIRTFYQPGASALTTPLAVADDANQLIDLWLHGKSAHSQDAYRRDIHGFIAFIECQPLQMVTVNDVQAFSKALASQGYSLATQCRKLSSVKRCWLMGIGLWCCR